MYFVIWYLKIFTHYRMLQPFIFQFICMQLCKGLSCFLKAHNKQLNKYCLNFFFIPQKKSFKKLFGSQVGLTSQNESGHESTCFCFGSKKFWVKSGQVNKLRHVLPCLWAWVQSNIWVKGIFLFIYFFSK